MGLRNFIEWFKGLCFPEVIGKEVKNQSSIPIKTRILLSKTKRLKKQ